MDPTQLMSHMYSICGLTIGRYANSLTFLEKLLRLHFKKFRVFVAFATMVDIDNDLLIKTQIRVLFRYF